MLLAIVISSIVAGTFAIAKFTIGYLLYHDAVSTGRSWTDYLATNVNDLEQIAAGETPSKASQLFFDRAQKVGQVFRYQIFDPQGHLRRVSDTLDPSDQDEDEDLAEHNPEAARSIAAGTPMVSAEDGTPPTRPPFFSEACVPVIVNGKTVAIVETYVDQTEKRQVYQKAFTIASVSLSLLIFLAFGIPAIAWYRRTNEKRRADAHISFLAHHDAMTGLFNRVSIVRKLETSLAALPQDGCLAVHYIDMDRFKDINDTFGHDAGDHLVREIAERLLFVAGDGNIVGRFGGDEFVVLQTELSGANRPIDVAHGIAEILGKPFVLNGHEVIATGSVGVALAPTDGRDAERLMKCADLALYKSKTDGRNCVRFFEPEMDAELKERLTLEKIVRDATLNDGFELYFQPAVDAPGGRLVGFEALLRLRAVEGAQISPAIFVPIAEQMGLIAKIGTWVIKDACRIAAAWPANLKVAVNLSPVQFEQDNICDIVAAALAEANLEPHRLELEITEGLLLSDAEAVMVQLRKLKALGVGIVMDDFGTGYSSLSYLWQFPFDKIKIDRAFMKAMDENGHENAETIVKTIIGLGRSLRVQVTVEGVENMRQLEFVRESQCDQIQGFYFGRPMALIDVGAHIISDYDRLLVNQDAFTGKKNEADATLDSTRSA
jgi:diguanylate cyclase (GGDEF)-like protein